MEVKLSKRETNLIQACINGDVATVEGLLNEGGNVNLICNDTSDTLLMTAVRHDNELVVNALLLHGANINAKNNKGNTALIIACGTLHYNDAIVKMLLNYGADVNISNVYDETALMYASLRGNFLAVKDLLVHNANANMKDINGETALLIACRSTANNYYKVVNELIDNGADVNSIDNFGMTPLMIACEFNNIDKVKVLLEYGAEIEVKDYIGKTALDYACENGNIEITKELIESGASVNNISERNMQFVTKNLSDCTKIKILTAILNRDIENIGDYLGEYFNKMNKDTSLNKMPLLEYRKHITAFYQVNNYIKRLKNSREVKELREETKILKEKVENATKLRFISKELDEIKQKVHRNKMILKELKTFEINIKDMLNIKTLRPIYCRKQSIDFEIK